MNRFCLNSWGAALVGFYLYLSLAHFIMFF
jgi:hypothetical protein